MTKPKIYAFCNQCQGWDTHLMVAIAEDGVVLGTHICSSVAWAQHDLHDRPDRKAACEEHYPDGYEFVILPDGQVPPEVVFQRNAALPVPDHGVETQT